MNLDYRKRRSFVDMTGQRVDQSTVLRLVKSSGDGARWLLMCDCGTTYEQDGKQIRANVRRSIAVRCRACLRAISAKPRKRTHVTEEHEERCRFAETIVATCLDEGLTDDQTTDALVALMGAMTQSEIAAAMGCTRQAVQQLEEKALRKLRGNRGRSLKEFAA